MPFASEPDRIGFRVRIADQRDVSLGDQCRSKSMHQALSRCTRKEFDYFHMRYLSPDFIPRGGSGCSASALIIVFFSIMLFCRRFATNSHANFHVAFGMCFEHTMNLWSTSCI